MLEYIPESLPTYFVYMPERMPQSMPRRVQYIPDRTPEYMYIYVSRTPQYVPVYMQDRHLVMLKQYSRRSGFKHSVVPRWGSLKVSQSLGVLTFRRL